LFDAQQTLRKRDYDGRLFKPCNAKPTFCQHVSQFQTTSIATAEGVEAAVQQIAFIKCVWAA